ncbi:MAG: threonine/serine dehydratase [Nitrososphaerota archaeon]|nr:threonine/serine dehydratase [Nitrososphaerota archaeon]MDG7020074.1 threonine/serine dehydratase [Nitrososphaerota archaeon]
MDVPRVSLAQVEDAAAKIRGSVYRTPLVPSSRFDSGSALLKLECLQPTGSFKVRGAWNMMSRASREETKRGFVTTSAGNHGQAVAWSAKKLGAACTVYVPTDAVQRKVDSMESMGAKVVRRPHQEIMEAMADDRMAKLGMTFVHPFGDPFVVAGQGTVGLEILEDLPGVRSVVVPVGGGGLASGIAQAVRAKSPGVKVYGVQAEGAAPLPRSLATGKAEDVGEPHTIADGIGATRTYDYMLPLLREHLEGAYTVSDEEIRVAMKRLLLESHVAPEPAGAASFACFLKHRGEIPEPAACVVSGGNADPALLASLLS